MVSVRFPQLGLAVAVAMVIASMVSAQPALGQTVPEFEDVPEGYIAKSAINWAAENGITVGVGNNRFGMGQTLTRYEMVTFLCRAFNPGNCRSGSKGSDRFVDVRADHWANYPVGWAVNLRITSGVSATEFGGIQTLTREQMITFLYRAKGSPSGGSPPREATSSRMCPMTAANGPPTYQLQSGRAPCDGTRVNIDKA